MHEYPLTEQIIRTAEKYAKAEGASKVTAIHLVIGEASGIMADSIELYFDLVAEGTLCEETRLIIKRVKPLLKCKKCGEFFKRKPFSFACTKPGCDGEGEPTKIGREFDIESIEILKE